LSCWRQGWSLQTLTAIVLVLLLAGAVVMVGAISVSTGGPGWNVEKFAQFILIDVYLILFLPLLCLCFGTQALGGEWEERNLVWVLTRPIPRPLIYLAKLCAALPWTLGCTLGGIWLAGLAAGPKYIDWHWNAVLAQHQPAAGPFTAPLLLSNLASNEWHPQKTWPGLQVIEQLWPAIVLGSFAYLALFVLLGALFRRSTIIGMAYAFLLEAFFGLTPGLLKRISLTFYTKCLAFNLAKDHAWPTYEGTLGIVPDTKTLFLPVSGEVAATVLIAVIFILLALGMWRFNRMEYRDLSS
jgi:ABC-type transport system involved in multi-copper enzyme maturation permease subunit